MDMTLSKRGDYVVRSAISLARAFEEGVPRKIREVVSEMEVPQTFASQILADLVRAGVASSRAGRNGGYWLATGARGHQRARSRRGGRGPAPCRALRPC